MNPGLPGQGGSFQGRGAPRLPLCGRGLAAASLWASACPPATQAEGGQGSRRPARLGSTPSPPALALGRLLAWNLTAMSARALQRPAPRSRVPPWGEGGGWGSRRSGCPAIALLLPRLRLHRHLPVLLPSPSPSSSPRPRPRRARPGVRMGRLHLPPHPYYPLHPPPTPAPAGAPSTSYRPGRAASRAQLPGRPGRDRGPRSEQRCSLMGVSIGETHSWGSVR